MPQLTVLGVAREIFHMSDESDPTEPQKAIILIPVPKGTTEVFSALSSISWEFVDLFMGIFIIKRERKNNVRPCSRRS
jgi:Na+/H+ antiporter NhaD/arsenite permease-like protein